MFIHMRAALRQRTGRMPRLCFAVALIACLAALGGCGDGGPGADAPAGLHYGMSDAVYTTGTPIPPNRPSVSGGAIERFTVEPSLPAGIDIDPVTGVIAGTPTLASPATVYAVTARNQAGTATARMRIEVRETAAAPAGLTYREPAVSYMVGETIADNTPSSTGGPIEDYRIEPALPPGLAFDTRTGVISGTPSATAAETVHTVTGSNVAGSTGATLRIAIEAAVAPPSSLSYASPAGLYLANEAIDANVPQAIGGAVTSFSISPALPAGLSMNTQTGVISGTATAPMPLTVYTVSGRNRGGTVQAEVRIKVTTRGTMDPSLLAPMLVPRHYTTATLLVDGRVLVAGGYTNSGVTGHAELYNPVDNTWTATGGLNDVRNGHTATRLLNGKVLVVGGSDGSRIARASAELYDPVTGTWSAAETMTVARENHTATLLADGRVLVAGGFNQTPSTVFTDTVEIYDPDLDQWTPGAVMTARRAQHAAVRLADDAVLLVGGVNGSGYVGTAETYRPGGTLGAPAGILGSVTVGIGLPDGSALAFADGSTVARRYSPTSGVWTSSAMKDGPRTLPVMAALPDGRVFVAGGANVTSAEVYHPDLNAWAPAASLLGGVRRAAAWVTLPDGSVLIVGGFAGTMSLGTVERFLP